jgi:hypothetical protein
MFRNAARLSQRATRSTPVRQTAQRRFNSSEAKPEWVVDNEFNRERAAVKHHAASTSGTFCSNRSRGTDIPWTQVDLRALY